MSDEEKRRLDEQARDLDEKAKDRPDSEKKAFQETAKLIRDRGFRKGLDDVVDSGNDPDAFARPVAYFRKKGGNIPEGVDLRHQPRG
jgi:hypothetical protein